MWYYSYIFTILCLIVAGVAATDGDCDYDRTCRYSPDIAFGFPVTVEELEQRCNLAISFLDCSLDVVEKCPQKQSQHSEAMETLQSVLSTVHKVCDKDGQFHDVVVSKLECLHEFFYDRDAMIECHQEQDEFSLMSNLLEDIDNEEQQENIRACMSMLRSIACLARKLGKRCGQAAMDTYVEVFRTTSFGIMMDSCDVDSTNHLLPTVIELQNLEEEIQNEIEKKRK